MRRPSARRLRRAQGEQVLVERAARWRPRPVRRRQSRSGPSPRTTATGLPSILPLTRSVAAAISSAIATTVISRVRPNPSTRPVWSSSGRTPAAADRHVGHPEAPGSAHRVGDDDPDGDTRRRPAIAARIAPGRRVGVDGQQHDVADLDVAGVDAGGRHHQPLPRLHDAGRAAGGLLASPRPARSRRRSPRRGSLPATMRPSALATTLLVTTTMSPSRSPVAAVGPGRREQRPGRSSRAGRPRRGRGRCPRPRRRAGTRRSSGRDRTACARRGIWRRCRDVVSTSVIIAGTASQSMPRAVDLRHAVGVGRVDQPGVDEARRAAAPRSGRRRRPPSSRRRPPAGRRRPSRAPVRRRRWATRRRRGRRARARHRRCRAPGGSRRWRRWGCSAGTARTSAVTMASMTPGPGPWPCRCRPRRIRAPAGPPGTGSTTPGSGWRCAAGSRRGLTPPSGSSTMTCVSARSSDIGSSRTPGCQWSHRAAVTSVSE